MKIIFGVIATLFLMSWSTLQSDVFVDPRDNQEYPTVRIDHLIWFQKNLNFKTESSVCFENENILCGNWGRLYSEEEAKNVCPKGWRLPSTDDWKSLKKIKINDLLDSTDWKNGELNTNSTGLSLQPSGMIHRKKFMNQFLNSTIWFEDKNDEKSHWHLHAHGPNNPDFPVVFHSHKESIKVRKFAVRCVCEIED